MVKWSSRTPSWRQGEEFLFQWASPSFPLWKFRHIFFQKQKMVPSIHSNTRGNWRPSSRYSPQNKFPKKVWLFAFGFFNKIFPQISGIIFLSTLHQQFVPFLFIYFWENNWERTKQRLTFSYGQPIWRRELFNLSPPQWGEYMDKWFPHLTCIFKPNINDDSEPKPFIPFLVFCETPRIFSPCPSTAELRQQSPHKSWTY